ncbi:hypothetical protein BABINDRAFT_22047, partial [Babjeviella inositovora NRRL Y-12698]
PLALVNHFLPEAYNLHLTLVATKPNFTGKLVAHFARNSLYVYDEPEPVVLQLHAHNLVITSAVAACDGLTDRAQVTYDKAAQIATLTLPSVFSALPAFNMTLDYIGKTNQIGTYQDPTHGVFKTNYLDSKTGRASNAIIATHTQPVFARTIFPCIDEVNYKQPITLTVTTDARFQVISNTGVRDTVVAADGLTKTVSFKRTPPIATTVFGLVAGDLEYSILPKLFTSVDARPSTLPVRVYTLVGELAAATYALSVAAAVLPKLVEMFQQPYPLDKLDFVALPFLSDGAMENWGCVTVQAQHLLTHDATHKAIRDIVAHELVHQWMGNMVSFDSWGDLWLNEAFATWLGTQVLGTDDTYNWLLRMHEMEALMDHDARPDARSIHQSRCVHSVHTTHDALDPHAYQRGIYALRMLANLMQRGVSDDCSVMMRGVSKFLAANRFKSVKLTDLWTALHPMCGDDVLALMHTATRVPGLPVVHVAVQEDKVVAEQHRFLGDYSAEELDLEDVPYYLPLNVRLHDGSVVNWALSDRKTVLDVRAEDIATFNTNRTGYYRVRYTRALCGPVTQAIACGMLSIADLIALASDCSTYIGWRFQTADDLWMFMSVVNAMAAPDHVLCWSALNIALSSVQELHKSLRQFGGSEVLAAFNRWVADFTDKMHAKINWNTAYDLSDSREVYTDELEARSALMLMGMKSEKYQAVAQGLYKNLVHGPDRSVPRQLLAATIGVTCHTASTTEYNHIVAMIKSAVDVAPHTNASVHEVQTAVLSCMGYAARDELVTATLDFVAAHIDATLIELALVGLQSGGSKAWHRVWDWFVSHYDEW